MPPKVQARGLGALAGTLHDAETRQVEDFIRQRSKALDSDISAMRTRLGMGGGAGKVGVLGEGIPNVLSTVEGMGTSTSVSTSLRALRDEAPVFSGHDTSAAQTRSLSAGGGQHSPPRAATMKDRLGTFLARIKIRMDDQAMHPSELRNLLLPMDLCLPSDTQVAVTDLIYVLQTDLVLAVPREDQLMLLQEYGDSSGDINVRNLLLDAGVWHEVPDATRSQEASRKADAALVRIRAGGMEDPVVDHRAEEPRPHAADGSARDQTRERASSPGRETRRRDEGFNDDKFATRPSSSSRPPVVLQSNASTRPSSGASTAADFAPSTGNFKSSEMLPFDTHANEVYGDLLDRSANNSDLLSEIHRLVTSDIHEDAPKPEDHFTKSPTRIALKNTLPIAEKEIILERPPSAQLHVPLVSAPATTSVSVTESSASSSAAFSRHETSPVPSSGAREHTANSTNSTAPLSLVEENARLRSELSAFDSAFWEQLEDLKFRYSRLQEVVGEEPEESDRGAFPLRPKSAAGSAQRPQGLPLDGLPWSTRNAMTAMDRVGITSALARGRHGGSSIAVESRPESRSTDRPHSHAYTYAPGTRPGTGSNQIFDDGFPGKNSRGFDKRGNKENVFGSWNGDAPASPSHHKQRLGPTTSGAPLLRHSTGSFPAGPLFGGIHGVGGGTHAPDGTGSLASMCERRLLFELGNHPAPEQSARSLIHRIQDVAHRKGANGRYITCNMLGDVMTSVGLRMSMDEVTMLATGFGSNGNGGIDSDELCEALQALLYNFIGEHEVVEREQRSKMAHHREAEEDDEHSHNIMVEICMSILTHDKKAILGAGVSLFDTLIDPFASMDTSRIGVLPLSQFSRVLRDLGVMLDHQENLALASRFEAKGSRAVASQGREHSEADKYLHDFRDERLGGTLKGAASEDPSFGNWLASNLPGQGRGRPGDSSSMAVDYNAFVERLADLMEDIIEKDGGMVPSAGLGGRGNLDGTDPDRLWMLREFDLIETLICQLELMRPSERRRCLLSLQYAVTAADSRQEGEIDGFSLLSALLGAGFRLQRLNRVRLLRAIEDLGGKMDYIELCQVLIRSCADWTSEERGVVSKILKAMGITVLERRAWLGRIRVALMKAAADYGGKATAFNIDTGAAGGTGSVSDPGIPPSAFLHILRESGVVLGVEEEATLLDCLDTERLADAGKTGESVRSKHEVGPEDGINRAVASIGKNRNRASAGEALTNSAFGGWGVPLIHYKSFLTFCARHTGDWMDAAPDNTERIHEAIRNVQSPATALQEFTQMIQAFDETSSGYIGNRAFQIACHRSRLFANLSDEAVKETADILTAEGGGKIRYTGFFIHLRAVCSQLSAGTDYPGIGEQLLKNATDAQFTLLPLRNWLLRNSDTDSCLLTPRDLNALLREFSVMYRPEDLEALLMEIGQSVGRDSEHKSNQVGGASKLSVLDSRDLLRHLFKIRGPWTLLQTDLCHRMIKSLTASGASMFAAGDGTAGSKNGSTFGFPKSSRGIESAAARRLLARLRAFADIVGGDRLVDLDIFGYVAKATGMPLGEEELLILADATDPHPNARQVRCDVVMEALTVNMPSLSSAAKSTNALSRGGDRDDNLPDAAQHALKHMQDQIWSTGVRLRRSPTEWIADVRAAFKGFDLGGAGFITTEDFSMTLALLNAPVSTDILRDIPTVPDGPGLIAYTEILGRVLIPPPSVIAQARAAERGFGGGGGRGAVDVDRSRAPHPGRKSDTKNSTSVGKKAPAVKEKGSPVAVLLSVVRKALHSFISTDDSLESAWMCLLKAFRRFDPTENGTVPPREFCLAVSVLLGGDEVLLSEAAWIEIIEAFAVKDDKKAAAAAGGRTASRSAGAGPADKSSGKAFVDYMEFCGAVLDAKALKESGGRGLGGARGDAKEVKAGGGRAPVLTSTGTKPSTQTQGSLSRDRARTSTNTNAR